MFSMVEQFTYHEGTSMRHRLIPAALAARASLALLADTAMAAVGNTNSISAASHDSP